MLIEVKVWTFEVGVKVWNITCDGTSTNRITLKKLGCRLNTIYEEIKLFIFCILQKEKYMPP